MKTSFMSHSYSWNVTFFLRQALQMLRHLILCWKKHLYDFPCKSDSEHNLWNVYAQQAFIRWEFLDFCISVSHNSCLKRYENWHFSITLSTSVTWWKHLPSTNTAILDWLYSIMLWVNTTLFWLNAVFFFCGLVLCCQLLFTLQMTLCCTPRVFCFIYFARMYINSLPDVFDSLMDKYVKSISHTQAAKLLSLLLEFVS